MKRNLTISLLILFVFLSTSVVIARPEAPTQYVPITDSNELGKSSRDYGWIEQASGFTEPSRGIHYMHTLDENIIWATAYDGSGGGAIIQEFTKTTNGGELWTPGEVNNASGLELSMIFALDANKAWVPMYKSSGTNLQGIYYTPNGGANWTRQGDASMYTDAASFPNVAHFWDENIGFAQGDPVDGYYELYTTTNGGTTWTRVPSRDIPDPLTGEFGIVGYYDVVGDTIWWGTNKGRVFKSTNKGYNWTVCNPVGSLTYVNIWFKDSMNGLLQDKGSGTTGTLYETSDGGETWTLVSPTGTVYYNDMAYVPGTTNMYVSTGAASGASGASYSTDGGHTWEIYAGTDGTQFLATDWANDECGYAGGFNGDQFTGGMFKYTYVPAPVLPPENLTAVALPDLTVGLNWSPPPSGLEGWIRWDNGTNAGSLGLNAPGEWDAASRFSSAHMQPYVGGQITKVQFFPTSPTTTYTIYIWSGPGASTVETTEAVTDPTIDDWNEIILTTQITIAEGTEYWIGYHMNQTEVGQPNGYPAGYDSGPALNGLWANLGGWTDISTQGFNYNWNIAGLVENPDGKTFILGQKDDLSEYNIYHSLTSGEPYDFVGSVPATDTTYIHQDPTSGTTNYYVVTAVYGLDESGYSNEASTYVEIASAVEYAYDDGTAEMGYRAGSAGSCLAVRITPDQYPVKLIRIKYYLTEVNQQMIVYAWDDDGVDGQPGTQLISPIYMIPTADLVANDWNVITLPDDSRYNIVIEDGDFYVGWFEASNSSLIGVDTNGPVYNRSWQYTTGTWYDYNMGIPQNMMIRAVVDTNVIFGVDDEPVVGTYLLQNYPNPVKGSTRIQYGIQNHNGPVEIDIYNILGQKVDSIQGEQGVATWNPEELPSGIYFYKLETVNFTQTRKMLLIK